MIWRFVLLSIGVFCGASAVVMTKISVLPPELLSAGRLLVATVALFPFFLRDQRRYPEFSIGKAVKISALPGALLALHFISWTIGARWTTSANSTLIVNLTPIAMPFLSYLILRELLNRNEWIGTALAILGILILVLADFRLESQLLAGDLVCIVSMILMAWYFVLARKYKTVPSIWLYLVPLYGQAGILCLVVGLARTGIPEIIPGKEWSYIAYLGLIPTVCGHSLLNLSMHWFRGQTVAIVNQLQFVYAGILGYFFFTEIPHLAFYLASLCMMAGVLWTIVSHVRQPTQNESSIH